MCGDHGCKLEVDDYGGKPLVCPYKYPNPEFELKEKLKLREEGYMSLSDDFEIIGD